MNSENTKKLLNLIEQGTSPFHTVQAACEQLKEAGFLQLHFNQKWGLDIGGKYYTVYHDSSLIAFTIGEKFNFSGDFRVAAAHTDFPCLRIKSNPDMSVEKYAQINVEIYGGAILNTWLDRPLSVAGRVALRSDNVFKPRMRYIDIKKPVFIIPNLAIHMNREINKGIELNKQTDMLPLAGMISEELKKENYFLSFLAKELDVPMEDILDFELSVYNKDPGEVVGIYDEFISAPRLDNITSVQALLTGITTGNRQRGINIAALFDHEEIGSKTKQGAGSMLLSIVLEKIYLSFGRSRMDYIESMADSILLSVDVAHALHPNQPGKSDPTNKCVLNEGICIKETSSQAYATDSEAVAIIMQICESKNIPYQKFANRSDGTSGGTLGSIASTLFPVRTIDIGIPLLAMHSSRELMGREDQENLVKLVEAYFTLEM